MKKTPQLRLIRNRTRSVERDSPSCADIERAERMAFLEMRVDQLHDVIRTVCSEARAFLACSRTAVP